MEETKTKDGDMPPSKEGGSVTTPPSSTCVGGGGDKDAVPGANSSEEVSTCMAAQNTDS